MDDFLKDFLSDIPRGVASRFLREQSVPQARWQNPEIIIDRKALAYNPIC